MCHIVTGKSHCPFSPLSPSLSIRELMCSPKALTHITRAKCIAARTREWLSCPECLGSCHIRQGLKTRGDRIKSGGSICGREISCPGWVMVASLSEEHRNAMPALDGYRQKAPVSLDTRDLKASQISASESSQDNLRPHKHTSHPSHT